MDKFFHNYKPTTKSVVKIWIFVFLGSVDFNLSKSFNWVIKFKNEKKNLEIKSSTPKILKKIEGNFFFIRKIFGPQHATMHSNMYIV